MQTRHLQKNKGKFGTISEFVKDFEHNLMVQIETIRGHQIKQQRELMADVNRVLTERIKGLSKKVDYDLEKTKTDVTTDLTDQKI